MPSVIRYVGALAGMDDEELRATFNGGLGMVAVLPPDAVPVAIRTLSDHGLAATLVGEVVPMAELGGARYAEGPLDRSGEGRA
jgi:phosphoribosylformylglycinamidine cyclo-ligase